MIVFPNCKINIGLNVVEKRLDKFHNIESIFYPVPLHDALEILEDTDKKKPSIAIHNSGIEIMGGKEDNLIYKAYYLLLQDFTLPAIQVYLHKAIPMGAGLGGGSANAAFFLKALNTFANLNLEQNQLLNYAKHLGSDCSFFIHNTPQYATQKGEILLPVNDFLSKKYLILVKPNVHVSTAEAYAGVTAQPSNQLLTDVVQLPIVNWKHHIKNDFESSMFAIHPVLEKVKQSLYTHGALYASMSGSGSTVYGIFDNKRDLNDEFLNHAYYSIQL